LENKRRKFEVTEEFIEKALAKSVKSELWVGAWPVYEEYEIVEEEGEPFVVAPISRDSFFEAVPYMTEPHEGEKKGLVRTFAGRSPLRDAMSFYAPLKTPELLVDLAARAEKEITPEDVKGWAETYGLLGFPDEDTVEANDGFVNYKVPGMGRRERVRSFAETALEIRACLRTYEAMTVDEEVGRDHLLAVANFLPSEAFKPFGPMERHVGKERSWLFRVIGGLIQRRLKEYCYPLFGARTRNGEATGEFALSWGFRGLVGAVWLHMAWLLEAENERVRRCKLRDCLRVIHFEPGAAPEKFGLKKNARGRYKTRRDRVFCKGRGCKQKYHSRKKAGWPGYS
jgi:hypothetical protein